MGGAAGCGLVVSPGSSAMVAPPQRFSGADGRSAGRPGSAHGAAALALTLVIPVSGLTQTLLAAPRSVAAPRWWTLLGSVSVLAVSAQSLLGARMATSWASQRCLEAGQSCQWLSWHRAAATPAALCVLLFVLVALLSGRWG